MRFRRANGGFDFAPGETIRITGTMNPQTRKFLRCYQIMVRNFVNWGRDPYDTRLSVDGVAHRADFVVMVHDTCRHDDRYLTDEGTTGRFGGKWFCVR